MLGYAREIAGRTEEYWCPIKHSQAIPEPHDRYAGFFDYGDAEGYRSHVDRFREAQRRKPRES